MINLNDLLEAIVQPVKETSKVLNGVSIGRFDVEIKGDYQGDFLIMKTAMNNTVTSIRSYIQEISDVLLTMANDDLTKCIDREYVGEFSRIKESVNRILERFSNVMLEMNTAAEHVALGARQLAQSSIVLAQGSTEQTESVESLNKVVSTINKNTAENAGSAKEAESLAEKSKASAGLGNPDMKDLLLNDKWKVMEKRV